MPRQLIEEEEDVFILDVCTPTEYGVGHIERAVLIPLRNLKPDPDALSPDALLPARVKELPCNRNTKTLVYCKVGKRGVEASSLLVGAGYKEGSNLEGGLTKWVQEGYPIVATYDSWMNVWYLLLLPQ